MNFAPATLNFTADDLDTIARDIRNHERMAMLADISLDDVADELPGFAAALEVDVVIAGERHPRPVVHPGDHTVLQSMISRSLLRLFPALADQMINSPSAPTLAGGQSEEETAALLDIAQKAIEVDVLARETLDAKCEQSAAYTNRKREFGIFDFVDRESPEWEQIEFATRAEYSAVQEAKRLERNAKSRLKTAIRRNQGATPPFVLPDPRPVTRHDPDTIPF